MTLMTTAQIGDWDHDTTGAPKDLFVTGDVHIGKSNGSLFVNGDIDVSIFCASLPTRLEAYLRANCADFVHRSL